MKRLVPVLLAGVLLPTVAQAHAVVEPSRSAPRAYQRYVLRVPNEFDDVATTRVEIRFPPQVRVISFAEVAGWQLEVVRDSAKRITGAVWTGSVAPARFVEFPFMAVNPEAETRLTWPVVQTYASGERVEWAGPPDGERPASTTEIGSSGGAPSRLPLVVAAGAAVLALSSLAVALRGRGER